MGFKVNAYRPGNWNVEPQRSEIAYSEVERISASTKSIMVATGNGPEYISVGDQFPSREGGRLIVRVRYNGADPGVIYYEKGAFYGHHGLYFWKDTWMEAFQTGAHWARGGAMIAMMQVELCMGIMAGAGGKVADYGLTAISVLKMLTEVDVKELLTYIPKVISARSILKRVAPTLYDKIFSMFIEKLLDNAAESVLASATAYLVGRGMGRLGRHKPGKLAETIKDIAGWLKAYIAIRVGSVAGAAAKDLKTIALNIKDEFANGNIKLTEAEATKIANELTTNRAEIERALLELSGVSTSQPAERLEKGFKV